MTQRKKVSVTIVILLVTVATLITGIKLGFSWLMQESDEQIVATKSGFGQQETKDIVDSAFAKVNLPQLELGDSTLSIASDEVLDTLQEHLLEQNIEMYELNDKGNRTWRIYNRLGLQYNVVWKGLDTPSTANTKTQVALTQNIAYDETVGTVALILAGTEHKNLEPLIELTTPLNFALTPASPFTLRNAVHAAHNWHEVLLDTRSLAEIEFDAVPFATAILSDELFPMSNLPTHQTNTLQQISLENSNGSNNTLDASAKIWLLDISEYPVRTVKQWIESLPKNIRLVRLSHWDVVSH